VDNFFKLKKQKNNFLKKNYEIKKLLSFEAGHG